MTEEELEEIDEGGDPCIMAIGYGRNDMPAV